MTKNELIVESCRHMAFQDLRDTLSEALDYRDATIAALRAEVERLKKQKKYFSSECVRKGTEILRLSVANADANAELTQLREDRRVLGAEVRSWRYQCVQENTEGGDVDGATCMVNAAMEATDSSKALERANG